MQKQKAKRNVADYFVIVLLSLFMIFSAGLPCALTGSVRAEGIEYTSVLEDLQQDENFTVEDYQINDSDYSLKLIQIAESVNNELFVYVFQPCSTKSLPATSINISTGIDNELSYMNYDLNLLSVDGQFGKYLVTGLTVKTDPVRYYDISSIFRAWDESIDEAVGGDNTVDEVAYSVARLYTVGGTGDDFAYICQETVVVEVTDKHVGFVRYSNASNIYQRSCDSHYIAFSTDYSIDKLVEADVYFVTRLYDYVEPANFGPEGGTYTYGADVSQSVSLNYVDKVTVSHPLAWFFPTKYTWTRISSVGDFIEDENAVLSAAVKLALLNKDWVLRFTETDYTRVSTGIAGIVEHGTRVKEVSILRLKFNTDGVVYDLGVVDNKQTGSIIPDGEHKFVWPDWLKALISALIFFAVIILLLIFAPSVIPAILRFIWFVLKYFFIGLWHVLKYIAIGIYWLFAWPFYLRKED